MLFIDYVNVLFLSNSQRHQAGVLDNEVVYRLCQCSLFKQFTTIQSRRGCQRKLFIDYVNVLFLSNSQPGELRLSPSISCLSIMSMFSF